MHQAAGVAAPLFLLVGIEFMACWMKANRIWAGCCAGILALPRAFVDTLIEGLLMLPFALEIVQSLGAEMNPALSIIFSRRNFPIKAPLMQDDQEQTTCFSAIWCFDKCPADDKDPFPPSPS